MQKKTWLAAMMSMPAIFLLGCSSSPPITYYSLDQGVTLPAASGASPSVAVAQAGLPDRLNRPQMVSRDGYEVLVSDQNRWAEPLKQAIPRVLADELGSLLNSSQVSAGGGLKNPDFRVLLDVQRFDAVGGRNVEVDVLWRVENRRGDVKPGRSSVVVSVAGDDVPAVVSAQRRALASVAAAIATEIRQQSSVAPAK